MEPFKNCSHCKNGYVSCPNCNGGHCDIVCPECLGQGLYFDAEYEKVRECQRCEGEGSVDASECSCCYNGLVECDVC